MSDAYIGSSIPGRRANGIAREPFCARPRPRRIVDASDGVVRTRAQLAGRHPRSTAGRDEEARRSR